MFLSVYRRPDFEGRCDEERSVGRFRPGLERLEDREVPASISFPNASGVVTIIGSSGNDTVNVKYDSTGTKVVFSASWGGSVTASKSAVRKVVFHGGSGNDYFNNATNVPSVAFGDSGRDILIGGNSIDYLYGGNDNDVLFGRAGNDRLYGQGGIDTLQGMIGNDYLDGGADGLVDSLWGQPGSDTFKTNFFQDAMKDQTAVDVVLI